MNTLVELLKIIMTHKSQYKYKIKIEKNNFLIILNYENVKLFKFTIYFRKYYNIVHIIDKNISH